MWRLRYWLSRLGVWLWFRFGSKKTYVAFRHTKCGSEVVQLADFRRFGPEFQCFKCGALVPAEDVAFRILSSEELEKIKTEAEQETDDSRQDLYQYFESAVLPHVVA